MTTRDALRVIVRELSDEIVVHTTGYVCRESCALLDRPGNFYMIGSMGLAPAIGLGLALRKRSRRVLVLDGDGALLMGLGVLAMVAAFAPSHFHHVVFDNGAYASTGHQPTPAPQAPLDNLALSSGYRWAARVMEDAGLLSSFRAFQAQAGPAFLLVKCVEDRTIPPAPRIPRAPPEVTRRVMEEVR